MSKIIKNYLNVKYGPALEDDKEVLSWIRSIKDSNYNFINGDWTKSNSKKTINNMDKESIY